MPEEEPQTKSATAEKAKNKGKNLAKKAGTEAVDKVGKFMVGPLPVGGWCCVISCAWFLLCLFLALVIWIAVYVGIIKGVKPSGCAGDGGCYLTDEAFTDTNAVNSADEVISKLSKYPKLQSQRGNVEKIITESKNAGINPAILIAFWSGEQSFGNPDAAFGCGVYGGKNRARGFDNQVSCAIKTIKKTINNESPYNQPAGANNWNRLLYNYVAGARKRLYDERGYVSDEKDDPRIIILQQLVPNQVVCGGAGSWDGDWLTGPKVIKKPSTNPSIVTAQTIKPEIIIIHNTGDTRDTLDGIWNYFNSGAEGRKVWTHFIVGKDGKIYQMAPANKRAVHCGGYNDRSIGIEGCGEFNVEQPNKEQYDSYLLLVKSLMQKYNIPNTKVYGHMELNTCRQWGCPGFEFLNKLRVDLNLNTIPSRQGETREPIDAHGGNPLYPVFCSG